MTGEQLRGRGLGVAAAGVVLIAWVVVLATTTEVGNPPVLMAAAVTAGLLCLCAAAAGVVAARITEPTVARLRHAFVVLEGAAMALFYPCYWIAFHIEQVGMPGEIFPGVLLMLLVPVLGAWGLVGLVAGPVHRMVFAAGGLLVPDGGEGEPARRIQALGTVLATVGALLAVVAVAVSFTAGRYLPYYLFSGVAVTLAPVLLGRSLTRVHNVHAARRKNYSVYIVVVIAFTPPASLFGLESVSAVLLGVVQFAAAVLVVIGLLAMRDYIGEWNLTWRDRVRWRRANR